MKSALVIIIAAILVLHVPAGSAGKARILLYDVDFGTPPHTVGEPPVTGTGDPPRKTPTSIPFGDPTVVEELGLLTDQPCAFGNGTTWYDQLQFNIGADYPGGFDESYDIYNIEMDILIRELINSQFTILLDVPHVHNIYFNADGTMHSLPAGLDATFEFGVPLHLEVNFDIPNRVWMIRLNDEVVHSDHHAGNDFRSMRLNLTGEHINDSVGIDNFKIYGEALPNLHVCCINGYCHLTSYIECDILEGEYHSDWDNCGPPDPCEEGTPVNRVTWGAIKSTYR